MKKQLAFPVCSVGGEFNVTHHGMTLRDYFAGQALADVAWDGIGDPDPEHVAYTAYRIADAMLKERDK